MSAHEWRDVHHTKWNFVRCIHCGLNRRPKTLKESVYQYAYAEGPWGWFDPGCMPLRELALRYVENKHG